MLAAVALFALGLVVLLDATGALDRAELSSVDARFEIRGERAVPNDVVVVGIDDVTFNELNERWQFWRRTFARALAGVARDKPKVIVYDVEFTEQSDDVEGDNALVLTTRDAGNVVLSATEVGKNGATKIFGGKKVTGLREGDGRQRAAARGLVGRAAAGAVRDRRAARRCRSSPSSARRASRWTAARCAATARGSTTPGPPGHIRYVSFSNAVKRTYKPGTFRNRIVVIGAIAPSLQDRHPTSWPAGEMAGPEIHANAIDTLLRGFPLHARARPPTC